MRTGFLLCVLLLSCGVNVSVGSASEKTDSSSARAVVLVSGLRKPWAVLPLENGDFLISLKEGNILHVNNGKTHKVEGMPSVVAVGQGGLLDLALSPDFSQDSMLYFSFSELDGASSGYGTSVGRGRLRLSDGQKRIENVAVIYRAPPSGWRGIHFGSRLVFDREGYLYVTLGERGSMERAQDLGDPYGSVLRLNPDGTVPEDNPLQQESAAREIWSHGHRNAQGMTIHPETGDIWLHEHGPKGGDELNIVRKGANYGWPRTTHGVNYDGTIISNMKHAPGIEDSVLFWVPSIAPSGITFYQGKVFPEWEGDIFLGALAGRHLRRLVLKNGSVTAQQVLFPHKLGRIRDVRTGKNGYLYVLTDGNNATLYRIEPGE